jgi:hypothetical protein
MRRSGCLTTGSAIRVAVVDDHEMFAESIARVLECSAIRLHPYWCHTRNLCVTCPVATPERHTSPAMLGPHTAEL